MRDGMSALGIGKRVGAIDIGTNTVLLLVAEGPAEAPVAVVERATITRLGQGVDRTRKLAPEAMARTLAALTDYAQVLDGAGVGRVDVVCTSAARDADNGAEFLERVRAVVGASPRIVGGDEEARLVFEGALTGLSLSGSVTVFDVGGGSTEIIHGVVNDGTSRIDASTSIDIGSVRLTERCVRHDPPNSTEVAAIHETIAKEVSKAPRAKTTHLVGVAGTVTTLSAVEQRLASYDSALVHGATLSRNTANALAAKLGGLSLEERRHVAGLDPARADVIVAGTLIVVAMLDWCERDSLIVSDRGVRWGLARRALGALGAPGSGSVDSRV
jgi:exopolyphosphatase/guanosine-5'-triphosphate,3'-diphosphate pyrophosphatase